MECLIIWSNIQFDIWLVEFVVLEIVALARVCFKNVDSSL
jgi:hypothetical protein